MNGQSSFPGFGDNAAPTDRLFFAIFPDAATAGRIALLAQQLRDEHGLTGKPLKTERFHVTLHHLGDYAGVPPQIEDSAKQAAASIAAAPFPLNFDRAGSFTSMPRNRPFVLRAGEGMAPLMAFQQALGMAMKRSPQLGRWAKPGYTPHVTLLYDDRGIAEQAVEPITWTAGEFVLVHSKLGENTHIRLASWPLR
ncbi:MAG: 2'-5' RNA ligase family protein [Polaromonas sp.]|nr:2'-5' RNA ligase family protein [Polaromonas sp.]